MPLILAFGSLFFMIKLYLEFNDRIIFQNMNLQVESKILNTQYKDAMMKFLSTNLIIYFLINSVFFGAQADNKQLFILALLLQVFMWVVVYYMDKHWKNKELAYT